MKNLFHHATTTAINDIEDEEERELLIHMTKLFELIPEEQARKDRARIANEATGGHDGSVRNDLRSSRSVD